MELVPCPACGAFSPSGAAVCADCKAPLPAEPEPDAAPPIRLAPMEPEEPAEAGPVVAEAPAGPAPFEGPPELMAKADQLEAEIAQKPTAPALFLQLAKIYAEANRQDLAIGVLERFLDLDPKNVYVRHRLAQLTGKAEPAPAAPAARSTPAVRSAPETRGAPAEVASFQAGMARRPAPAPVPNVMRRMSNRTKAAIGGGLALVLLVVAVKVWLFPSTRLLVGGDKVRAFGPSFSPTGKHLAFMLDEGSGARLAVYDFRAGSYRALAKAAAWDSQGIAWSPDGTRIAYTDYGSGGDEAVHVVDVGTGQTRRVAAGSSPSWSIDGQSLLMTCRPQPAAAPDEETSFTELDWSPRFCTVNAATGQVRMSALAAEHGISVSPMLQKAVFERYAEGEETAAEETPAAAAPPGAPPGAVVIPEGEFQDFAQSVAEHNSRNIAQGSHNLSRELSARQYMEKRKKARGVDRLPYRADVMVADLSAGRAIQVTHDGQSAFPSWSPDGSRIVFATNGSTGIEIWSMNADGGDRRRVLAGGLKVADPSSITLSADGGSVFFISPVPGDPGLAKMMTGESPADLYVAKVWASDATRLSNKHPFKQRFAVSPDGRRVAYEVLQNVTLTGGAARSEIWLMRR
jgi:Tol biopolymer transport system component